MSSSSGNKGKPFHKREMAFQDENLRRLGRAGRRAAVASAQNTIATYEGYASRNPAETAHDHIQLRRNVNAQGTSNTKSSQEMDNIRTIGRLLERVEVLEAEKLALKRKNTEFKDENRALKRKNAEFEDKIWSLKSDNADIDDKTWFLKRKDTGCRRLRTTHNSPVSLACFWTALS
ncbi:hypothetical protein FMUND_11269 [Fusarium mundagurra]|uniref:Uncharacterized protein n=1 Tax=Fusarium mundagurra TaxID=1567541 RepID=A0A8H5Y8I4_9HYPO|nr:hypothetical protein FMUND_11269 [Fusarium mundagurra]